MSAKLPKYLSSIVIGSDAVDIRVTEESGPPDNVYTASITAGTYYLSDDNAADDLCKEIEDALNAGSDGADPWSVTISGATPDEEDPYLVVLTRWDGFNDRF